MAAVTSAVIAVGSTAYSFAQAAKQNKQARQAEAEAAKAMADARKKLDVNYMEALSVNMQPYEMAREAAVSAGAQQIEAARESERGVAATAGRLQMAQTEAQQQVRAAMGQELSALEKATAEEESRLRDVGVQLDLEEVQGAQQKAADLQAASAQSIMQGVGSLASAVSSVGEAASLYGKGAGSKSLLRSQQSYETAAKEGKLPQQFMTKDAKGNITNVPMPFTQALSVKSGMPEIGQYTADQFMNWQKDLGRQRAKIIAGYDWTSPSIQGFTTR